MKFIHIADVHFDMPFTVISKKGLAEKRRIKQREAFKRVIEYIQENSIEILFISGDLYENEYVRKSTIDYINNLFKEIPDTRIYISPGNHDPYIFNSYYKTYNWNENVYIFKDFEKIDLENINIYGYGFTNFTSLRLDLPADLDDYKINVLVMHADLDTNTEYNSIPRKTLEESKFDYIALGHIHKRDINGKIVYPGSLISGGFDELGSHGMILGEINEETKKLKLEFIKIDEEEFKEINLDISEIYSEEELIEKINNTEISDKDYYKIILEGQNNFEINTNMILKNIDKERIIKIKDSTKTKYDLEKISKENSLRGIFTKELLETINEENKEDVIKAIEIGLNLM